MAILAQTAVWAKKAIYKQASLDYLHNLLGDILEEDEARLSPLVHEHLNVLGRYSFTLNEHVRNGHLRPLNTAKESVERP